MEPPRATPALPSVRPWIAGAAALLVAGAAVVFTLVHWVQAARRHAEASALTAEAARFAADAQGDLQRRIDGLVRLARDEVPERSGDADHFFDQCRFLIAYQPGFQAIEWADAQGVVRRIEPFAGNEAALNYDMTTNPLRAVTLREARDTRAPVVSALVNLIQGGQGFLVLVPLPGGEGGFIVGVLRSEAVFGPLAARYAAAGFAAAMTDPLGTPVAMGFPAPQAGRPQGRGRMRVAGATWSVTLAPVGGAAGATWPEVLILGGGLVFVVLAALLVLGVGYLRREHAEALQTAAVLGDEVREHLATRALLEQARDRAQASAAYKSEILRTLSHETRTPLTAVLGYASLIQRQPGAAEAGAWAGVIIKATKRLLALLERLLLLSRLEAGALALELQPVALAGAVAETCESLEPLAAEKGLVTSCDCAADLLVRADAVYLHEVLANVVGNAIRYTPSGSVRLTAARVGDRVRISVTDTGVGFDPVLLQSPFEPFRRGPSEAAASADGAGLGLSITKGLVAQMQGSLLIESERGRGTTVTINLPAASVAE